MSVPTENRQYIVVGAGGHALVIADALALRGHSIVSHISPKASSDARLGTYLGTDDALSELATKEKMIAIGLGFVDQKGIERRMAILDKITKSALATIIHPNTSVAISSELGTGTFVAAGAVVGNDTTIARGAIINTGAIVDHDCRIGVNCHIATGARLAGGVTIGDNCLIGIGAIVKQGVQIGSGSIVGAGAVVLSDVPVGGIAIGVPAKLREQTST